MQTDVMPGDFDGLNILRGATAIKRDLADDDMRGCVDRAARL
jgi:hypothetical protein